MATYKLLLLSVFYWVAGEVVNGKFLNMWRTKIEKQEQSRLQVHVVDKFLSKDILHGWSRASVILRVGTAAKNEHKHWSFFYFLTMLIPGYHKIPFPLRDVARTQKASIPLRCFKEASKPFFHEYTSLRSLVDNQ